jgi:DNA-binding beta-propeller fold protein YncE
MKPRLWGLAAGLVCLAQLLAQPALPHRVVRDWPQLPKGINFGECSSVDVDKSDNVWVFNRGPHPVIQFDKHGKMLQAWSQDTFRVRSAHGIRVDPDSNIWCADVKGHVLFKLNPAGRILMVLGQRQGTPGNNDSKDGFHEPTGFAFLPNGDFYVSDGYLNSRVVKFNRDGEYLTHWGRKGTGAGEFDLVHDVCLDSRGRVYVADRSNQRIQVFDAGGKFLAQWTGMGQPQSLYYVARENAIYMCSRENQVFKLNLEGQILGVLGGEGHVPGRFHASHGIAVDSEGSIYVAEVRGWRAQKFAKP